jgi:prepilin-type N-terminal cleavage/methylation domain-containing protein
MLNRTRKGMTLLELIVVIVILGILAAIAIPTFEAVIGKSKTQSASTTAAAIGDDASALAAFDNPAGWADSTYMTTAAGEVGATVFSQSVAAPVSPATFGVGTAEVQIGSYCATLVGNDVSGTVPAVSSVVDATCS